MLWFWFESASVHQKGGLASKTPPRWSKGTPRMVKGKILTPPTKTPPRWPKETPRTVKGKTLFLVGLFFLVTAFSLKGYQNLQQNILSFSQAPELLKVVEEGNLPEKIIIPKLKIDLSVLPAKVINDQWETSEVGVSYLLGSGLPGLKGNLVIYGHNKNHLFGPIRWFKKEDKIKVINKKGEEFTYQVVETKTVSPEMVEVLAPTQDSTLTLYTCTGFLDRQRFVVIAKLQSDLN